MRAGRRPLLKALGSAGMLGAFAPAALPLALGGLAPGGRVVHEIAGPGGEVPVPPQATVRFSVCGNSHDHIYGMVGAMLHGGGELVSVYTAEPERRAAFLKRFPQARSASTEAEVLEDPSVHLVLTSAIPADRAAIAVRAMRHGKDFLSDKPGMTTLEQLAEIRQTIRETGRTYGILYSERLEVRAAVKAGELVKAGAIGRVVQTINIAPHQITQHSGDAGGGSGRPEWFWHEKQFGGILTDIGSHQVDQFLFYTGSDQAEVVASEVANVNHGDHPEFQDFGCVMLQGNRGFGYVRVDWFTPDGLGTWGDGRLFLLGTEGYIELRKYIDIAGRKGGDHLFVVNAKETRYIDCKEVELPFGAQFIADIANRTHIAQDQAQCLLAAELVLKAQRDARRVTLV